jgi:hypothetical protein
MLKTMLEGKTYEGRTEDRVPMQLVLDRETALLLNELAPGKKERSAYVARLVHAEKARREERQRMQQFLAGAGEEQSSV